MRATTYKPNRTHTRKQHEHAYRQWRKDHPQLLAYKADPKGTRSKSRQVGDVAAMLNAREEWYNATAPNAEVFGRAQHMLISAWHRAYDGIHRQ